jgi:hypothetical protein
MQKHLPGADVQYATVPDGSPTDRGTRTEQTVTGGRTLYGLALGILMLDTCFPRLPGDIGRATTWPFPVAYHIVSGAVPRRVVGTEPDPALLGPFIDGARNLESLGVPAIITSCGFLAAYQRQLTDAVAVPVFTSAILQVPFAATVTGRRVAIVTAGPPLTDNHFAGAGWSSKDVPIVQVSPPPGGHFRQTYGDNSASADVARLERELGDLAHDITRDHPDVGALVLE